MWPTDPKVSAALVAFLTSIFTIYITAFIKSKYEKHFHIYKLKADHLYEQRKKIKEILSKNKIGLLNSCEHLNYRLWNFTAFYKEDWHCMNGEYNNLPEKYYFASFVYRVAIIFTWIKRTEDEMIYQDTTIASKEDLTFVKFLRLFPQVMCDAQLFKGVEYDKKHPTDHFFFHDLERISENLLLDDKVYSFSQFQENWEKEHSEKLKFMCSFIDDMSPNETNRYRWDRLNMLHLTVVIFLNSFGYDFQKTNTEKLQRLLKNPRQNRFLKNYSNLLKEINLDKNKNFKELLGLIK